VTTTEVISKIQEETLDGVVKSQQAVVDAVSAWSKSVQRLGAQLPVPPRAEGAPTPEEVLETSFDFTQKLFDAQRDFARNLLAATAPATKAVRTKS
jgi:hypothetical protein